LFYKENMAKPATQETPGVTFSPRDRGMMGPPLAVQGFDVISRTTAMVKLAQTITRTAPGVAVTDVAPDGFHAVVGPTSTTSSRELMFINDSPLSVGDKPGQITSDIHSALFMGQQHDRGVIITIEPHNGSTSYEFVQSNGNGEHLGSNGIAFDNDAHAEAVAAEKIQAREQKRQKNLRHQANANRITDGTRWKKLTPKRSGGVYKGKK